MIRLARKLFSRGGSTIAPVTPAVSLHELLGRPAVNLDTPEIQRFLAGKRVLVSGAGGSIGSEICRQIMKFCPGRILLVEQAENNLFEIDRELRQRWIGADIRPYIADICDRTRIEQIFQSERPHVVFHCAAHKHVPMMELNPCEAIKNNVLGTKVIADAAADFGVAAFVMVSTDKAVNPTSVMGATKRMAEVYVQAKNRREDGGENQSEDGRWRMEDGGKNQGEDGGWRMEDGKKSSSPSSILHPLSSSSHLPSSSSPTRFVAVRFGNVLGSSGSVVPIFQKQIEAGGPVTVTHPDMQRYFMTIPEASQLVMQAGAIGQGGEIFVLDMGEPIRILDLAKEMVTRHGLKVGQDIEIQITGVRPGEKLYEELSCDNEQIRPTSHEKIHVWQLPVSSPAQVEASVKRLTSVINGTREQAIAALMDCVPEFQSTGMSQAKSPKIPTLRLASDSETLAA